MSGASNKPGISSVIRIKLIVAEPVFLTTMLASTACWRNDLNVSVEYVFEISASTTVKELSSSFSVPSVLRVARGRTV